MTLARDRIETEHFTEPEGVAPRAVLVVLPGRGEAPAVYERLGRRLAADAYRVAVVPAPTDDPAAARDAVTEEFATADPDLPHVLVGSDAGAAYAVHLVTSDAAPALNALILAGLPTSSAGGAARDWDAELDARTACSAHRRRISTAGVRPAELFADLPGGWFDAAPPGIRVPVLGLHGHDDVISSFGSARRWYAAIPRAELFGISGGRHDVLNDQTHRTVAATIVLFLERLRLGTGLLPIAVPEPLPVASRGRATR